LGAALPGFGRCFDGSASTARAWTGFTVELFSLPSTDSVVLDAKTFGSLVTDLYNCLDYWKSEEQSDRMPSDCKSFILGFSGRSLETALPCQCNMRGSRSEVCEKVGRQLLLLSQHCRSNFATSAPEIHFGFGRYGPQGCRFCNCSRDGSISQQCETTTGSARPRCPCPGGAVQHAATCSLESGSGTPKVKCNCEPGYLGDRCDAVCRQSLRPPNHRTLQPVQLQWKHRSHCSGILPSVHWLLYQVPKTTLRASAARSADPASTAMLHEAPANATACRTSKAEVCTACRSMHYNFTSGEGCSACACDKVGSANPFCDSETGACSCRIGRGGRRCDQQLRVQVGHHRSSMRPMRARHNGHAANCSNLRRVLVQLGQVDTAADSTHAISWLIDQPKPHESEAHRETTQTKFGGSPVSWTRSGGRTICGSACEKFRTKTCPEMQRDSRDLWSRFNAMKQSLTELRGNLSHPNLAPPSQTWRKIRRRDRLRRINNDLNSVEMMANTKSRQFERPWLSKRPVWRIWLKNGSGEAARNSPPVEAKLPVLNKQGYQSWPRRSRSCQPGSSPVWDLADATRADMAAQRAEVSRLLPAGRGDGRAKANQLKVGQSEELRRSHEKECSTTLSFRLFAPNENRPQRAKVTKSRLDAKQRQNRDQRGGGEVRYPRTRAGARRQREASKLPDLRSAAEWRDSKPAPRRGTPRSFAAVTHEESLNRQIDK
uniref:EGF-like domain-containing protein n=1 Tax=Macrostomum lignano TaxID=282301 RepID=A0A1I8FIN2_9PLAT